LSLFVREHEKQIPPTPFKKGERIRVLLQTLFHQQTILKKPAFSSPPFFEGGLGGISVLYNQTVRKFSMGVNI
jgi:hypothetical protein